MSKQKYVYVRRRAVINPLGDDNSNYIWKIGASLKGRMSLKGLTYEEERKLLPEIIGVQPTAGDWGKRTDDYWKNISATVPDGEGLKLNISIGENNKPENVIDYVLYKYCLAYSRVANTPDEVGRSPKIRFYLFSDEEEMTKKVSKFKDMKKAEVVYLDLATDKDAQFAVLRIFSTEPNLLLQAGMTPVNIDDITNDEKEMMFYEISHNKHTVNKFLTVASDKNLLIRSFVEDCIFYGKLQRVPNTTTILRETVTIGNTMKEAIAFLGNATNSLVVKELKVEMRKMTNRSYTKTEKVNPAITLDEVIKPTNK